MLQIMNLCMLLPWGQLARVTGESDSSFRLLYPMARTASTTQWIMAWQKADLCLVEYHKNIETGY